MLQIVAFSRGAAFCVCRPDVLLAYQTIPVGIECAACFLGILPQQVLFIGGYGQRLAVDGFLVYNVFFPPVFCLDCGPGVFRIVFVGGVPRFYKTVAAVMGKAGHDTAHGTAGHVAFFVVSDLLAVISIQAVVFGIGHAGAGQCPDVPRCHACSRFYGFRISAFRYLCDVSLQVVGILVAVDDAPAFFVLSLSDSSCQVIGVTLTAAAFI